ncbi:MAG TPA: hypothetical protein VHW04_03650 [Solirubrobacteraceae bacterium]|jgi:hypothetical protein|nr:hypothetical protein [Solirubrobacteraceae bacterium]
MPDERQGNPEKQPLPGSVSDQNAEEQPSSAGQQEKRRRPGSGDGGDDSTSGGSSEGTQSTGNPDSAG